MFIWEEVTLTENQHKFQLDNFGFIKIEVPSLYHWLTKLVIVVIGFMDRQDYCLLFSLGSLHNILLIIY